MIMVTKLHLSNHLHNSNQAKYEGCPSKSWTIVITQDCIQVTL